MATTVQQTNFIREIGAHANKIGRELGLNQAVIDTCICMACCESAYGTSSVMRAANGYFGIKATSYWTGKTYSSKTKEYYNGYVTIDGLFRAYNNMADSVRDFYKLISNSRYKECLTKTTVNDCVTVIKNCGYCTSTTYINTINSIFNKHKNTITALYNVSSTTIESTTIESTTIESTKFTYSKDYAKVLQFTLNQILNTNLAIDGIIGPKSLCALTDLISKLA